MLRFRLLGVPVAVRPSFLLIAALLGLQSGSVAHLIIWVVIVFVSILIHEFGHALTARRYGADVEIELNGIGGLTTWALDQQLSPGRRALVAAAGSGVGVIFGGLIFAVASATGPYSGLVHYTLTNLVWVNLFWGLLNWLPIRPLDGGHLVTSLLEKVAPRRGEAIANVLFIITPAVGAVLAFRYGFLFAALLAGFLLLTEMMRFGGSSSEPRAPITVLTFDDETEDGDEVPDGPHREDEGG